MVCFVGGSGASPDLVSHNPHNFPLAFTGSRIVIRLYQFYTDSFRLFAPIYRHGIRVLKHYKAVPCGYRLDRRALFDGSTSVVHFGEGAPTLRIYCICTKKSVQLSRKPLAGAFIYPSDAWSFAPRNWRAPGLAGIAPTVPRTKRRRISYSAVHDTCRLPLSPSR